MKIGILTFHCAHNYGAVLQCYALQEYLRSLGHDVCIINYRPEYLASPKARFSPRKFFTIHLCKALKKFFKIQLYRKSYDKYQTFEDLYFCLTECICEKENLSNVINQFDYIVIGSDQIWNKNYNGNDKIWFAQIDGVNNVKYITYAASAGDVMNFPIKRDKIKNELSNFIYVSVREQELANVLSDYINVECVLDPSLLLPPDIWKKFYNILPRRKKNYIVTYQAREDYNVFRIAKELARQLNCEIITTDFCESSFNSFSKHKILSPIEFISLIKNAKCVVTTSFHGTAFSIITKTPFYTIRLNDNADLRSESLLNSLGLIDRFVEKDWIPIYKDIDFTEATKKLDVLRRDSQQKLNKALRL